MEILRKYGVQTTILFPLVDYGANDFEATPVSHASGDTKISKDEGAFANTSNAFAHEGMGIYSIVLTATEMEAARIAVTIVDTATKAWEDQAVIISTYGNASAQHEFDLDSATVTPGAGTITASVIATDAIDADAVADGAITSGVFAAGAITATAIATNAIGADELADGAITAATFAAGAIDATAVATDAIDADALATNAVTEIQSGLATAASIAALSVFVDTEVAAILAAVDTEVAAILAAVDTEVGDIKAVTDTLTLTAIADAVLSRAISNVDGSASFRTLAGAVAKLVNKIEVAAGTLTVYQSDDTTPFGTQAVAVDATADPIVSLDTA